MLAVRSMHTAGEADSAGHAMGELTGETFAGLQVGDAVRRDLVSTIYEADEPDAADPVALRVVAEDLCRDGRDPDPTYRQFLRRAAAALTFEHDGAPLVTEVGEHRGRGYLVASYADTLSLTEHIAEQGPLPPHLAIDLFVQVADVLDASHAAGLVHGAVSPATLRVLRASAARAPRVWLTGFGIGALLELRLRRGRKHLDLSDELLYVAPEQLRSERVTARADQYAMACALVHALTGDPPFVRDTVGGVFGAHLFVAPVLDERVPADGPIRRALAKEPDQRYPTCAELVDEVRRAADDAGGHRTGVLRHAAAPGPDDGPGARPTDGPRRGATVAHLWQDAGGAGAAPQRPMETDRSSSIGSGEVAGRPSAPPAPHDISATADRPGAAMAYPTDGTESEAAVAPAEVDGPGTALADDDDAPLLSEVLRHRPRPQRPARGPWSMSGALVALFVVAMVATAAAVWALS